ncbi:MAG: N-acetylornithine carbamoyltransferase [Cytophagales bacterium]|nr:N-acetylornithine carbamoyltransferase [Bernardetiaceae bacterium]MDW8211833.1 N-acetylornithine carbamoyltransferase [Cytophagales bacterium]
MKQFTSVADVANFLPELIREAIQLKKAPFAYQHLGKNKVLGLVFMNPSLRTRLSTQRAAFHLGMQTIVVNADKDTWKMASGEGIVMDGEAAEHIKDAVAVMGQYCDILGVRSFAGLANKEEDYAEQTLNDFIRYAGVPVISLESATRHPLQSLADLITIEEYKKTPRPKVVLTWAPHPKALPQAVPNSFAEWMLAAGIDLTITHPEGYELNEQFTRGAKIVYDQRQAFKNADFIYAKNWSSYTHYGQILSRDRHWTVTTEKMALTNQAYFMHCLPVRRNVVVEDAVIDSQQSIVIPQAANRVWACQAVLKRMLESL